MVFHHHRHTVNTTTAIHIAICLPGPAIYEPSKFVFKILNLLWLRRLNHCFLIAITRSKHNDPLLCYNINVVTVQMLLYTSRNQIYDGGDIIYYANEYIYYYYVFSVCVMRVACTQCLIQF